MNKKQAAKLLPGTLVKVSWSDSEPTLGLVLEKPDGTEKGDQAVPRGSQDHQLSGGPYASPKR